MKLSRGIAVGSAAGIAAALVWMLAAYVRDIGAARRRVASGSEIAATRCGPIEYAERGRGPPVLVVHGAGGGFDQGLMLGAPLAERGYRTIAMSRFGYLRTPLPPDATAEAQADAHACLLDALGIDRAAILGVSAGGPSTIQFCLRHPDRCSGMVLMVPLAYSGKTAERLTPAERILMERSMDSDFLFWAGTKLAKKAMIEKVLGTPIEVVRGASRADQRRMDALLATILPVSPRAKGLANEGRVAQALAPLPLERIAVPVLIGSVEDDGYRTLPGARWTAEHIPGARLVVYPRGGHMMVGHEEEWTEEMLHFLDALSAPVQ